MNRRTFRWSSNAMKEVVDLYPTTKNKDIADKIGCEYSTLVRFIKMAKISGLQFPKKQFSGGYVQSLIKETFKV